MNYKLLIPILITSLISACGWQMRGQDVIPPELEKMHVSARNPDGDVARYLKSALRSADIELVDNATDALYSLILLEERSKRRTATVSASARVSELQLTEEVEFLILDQFGTVLLPRTTVSVERVYEYNEANVLATEDEGELLQKEMRRDLVRQILSRFRQLKLAVEDEATY